MTCTFTCTNSLAQPKPTEFSWNYYGIFNFLDFLFTQYRKNILRKKKSWKFQQLLLSNRHIQETNNFKVCGIIWDILVFYFHISLSRYTHLSLPKTPLPDKKPKHTYNWSSKYHFKWSQTWMQTWHYNSYISCGQAFMASCSSNYLIYAKCPNCQFPYMKLHITLGKTR